MFYEPTEQEVEQRKRIQVAVWAFAYEFMDDPIVDDDTFDRVCYEIDVRKPTNRPDLDKWFRKNFSPETSMWVRNHPELKNLEALYRNRKTAKRGERFVVKKGSLYKLKSALTDKD